jgi:hypothetical protein
MANSILRFPLPLKGLNTINPYIDHESGFARELTNYSIVNGRLFMRPPVVVHNALTVPAGIVWWHDPGTVGTPAILSDGSATNLGTGAVITAAGTYTRQAFPTEVTFAAVGGTLQLVLGILAPRNRASPFAAAGPTPSATFGTSTAVHCGCAHKGRLYYANSTTRIEYGDVGQIAGAFPAANFLDLSSFLDGQAILRMFSISLSPGLSPTQSLFVVFGDRGKVLVYQGDFPGSVTWSLISSFDMPKPLSRGSFVEIDGDIFVCTSRYCYWFRDLFAGGARSAYESSPSLPIENLWQACLEGASTSLDSATYYPEQDAIIIHLNSATAGGLNSIFNYQNSGAYFVYFRKYQAWALWGATLIGGPFRIVNDVLYGASIESAVYSFQEGAVTFDTYRSGADILTIPIETSWKTPYAYLDKGIGLRLNSARGWYELQNGDATETVALTRAIFDNSDYNAPWGFYTQNTVTQIPPGRSTSSRTTMQALAWNQYQPLLQVGGDGSAVSFQTTFLGASPPPGYLGTFTNSVYGLSALVTPGSEIF